MLRSRDQGRRGDRTKGRQIWLGSAVKTGRRSSRGHSHKPIEHGGVCRASPASSHDLRRRPDWSSLFSHTLAMRRSRLTVATEIPSSAAISSHERPPK